jgi:CheY-like chemotaxis protein
MRAADDAGEMVPRRVLVVDDNSDSAESLAIQLRMMGHVVATAHDGLEAIDRAVTFQPGVVLLDLGLPGVNGYQAARRIRAGRTGVKIVALTGWGNPEDLRRSAAAGFDAHLVKPVALAEVIRVLADLGGSRER